MLFQNTNGFDENADDTKTNDGLRNSKDLQVSILTIAEHHLNTRHQQVVNNFTNAIKTKLGPSMTYGSSCATDKNEYPRKLYGGTSITASNGWNARICERNTDGKWDDGRGSP